MLSRLKNYINRYHKLIITPKYTDDPPDYDNYWEHIGEYGNPLNYHRNKIFSEWISEDSKVLDVGCGDGTFLAYLMKNKNCNAIGLDLSYVAVNKAIKKGVKAYIEDVTADSFKLDMDFDHVILAEILEHVVYPEKIIKKIKDHTKHVSIAVPNTAYFAFRLGLLLGYVPNQTSHSPAEHLRFWSYTGFVEWLHAQNLEIISFKPASGIPFLKKIFPNIFCLDMCFLVSKKEQQLQ